MIPRTESLSETFVPLTLPRRGARRVVADTRRVHDATLLEGIARGLYWQGLISRGIMENAHVIARAEGVHFTVVTEHLRLTLLAPGIIALLMAGKQPRRMNLTWLMHHRLPFDWNDQWQIVRDFEEDT